MQKPVLANATSPSESQLPSPPFGPVEDHLALQSAQSPPGCVCVGVCVVVFVLEEGWFRGSDLGI